MNCIEIEKFSFRYPQSERMMLKNINMEVEDGSFVVICGKSGCGKRYVTQTIENFSGTAWG